MTRGVIGGQLGMNGQGVVWPISSSSNTFVGSWLGASDWPADWTTWISGAGSIVVAAEDEGRILAGPSDDRTAWARLDSFSPDNFDLLVRATWPSSTSVPLHRLMFRWDGSVAGDTINPANGYFIVQRPITTPGIRLYSMSSGSATLLTSISEQMSGDRWMRLKVVGSSIKWRWWANGDPEPSTWQIDTVDSTHSTGKIGFQQQSTGINHANPLALKSLSITELPVANTSYLEKVQTLPNRWAVWPLQESVGATTVSDVSGNNRHGTVVSGVTWGDSGPLGGTSATFAGSVGTGTSPTGITVSGIFTLSGTWTVSGWMWQASPESQSYLLGSNTVDANSDYWSITNRAIGSSSGEGFMVLSRRAGTTTFLPSPATTIDANSAWHHWAVTKEAGATGLMRFYIDGAEVHSINAVAQESNLANLSIGRITGGPSSSYTYAFTGRQACLSVHTTTLTPEQITDLASSTTLI